jgi:hypothetical protein
MRRAIAQPSRASVASNPPRSHFADPFGAILTRSPFVPSPFAIRRARPRRGKGISTALLGLPHPPPHPPPTPPRCAKFHKHFFGLYEL